MKRYFYNEEFDPGSGCRKFIDLIQIPIIFNRITTLSDKYWRFYFFYLYYLYCLSIFQRTCCFRFKSGCKGKGFIFNYQTFSEVFLFFSLSAISLFHYVNSARLSSLGKRVQKYALLVYNPNILKSFFEVFLKESAKVLKDNDVVEHIFYHEWIAGGNGTHGIHYYITRGRVGARKREKDAEERNNKITVELQLRKRQQEERDKKMI